MLYEFGNSNYTPAQIKEVDVIGASGQERNPAGSALISTSTYRLQNIIKNFNEKDHHLLKYMSYRMPAEAQKIVCG